MAYESRINIWQVLFVVAAVAIAVAYFAGKAQPQIVVNIPQQQPTQIQTQPIPTQETTPKLVDTAKLVVVAMDPEANPITRGTVELWKVTNVSEVTEKAFYATEGYSRWMYEFLDSTGIVEFTISRAQWDVIKRLKEELGVKIYAVVLPPGNYYRAGVEVPELSFYEGSEVQSVTVIVSPVAQYYDIINPVVDIRGLKAGDTKTKDYAIITISENEKGVLKIYKLEIAPGELSTLTTQFDYLKIKIGDNEVDLIEDGDVQLTDNEEVVIPVKELKATEELTITIEYKLAADPDASVDGARIADIAIYDVNDAMIGTTSVTINTA